METEAERIWLHELENFISHWERETETIKDKSLDLDECSKISDIFHKDWNGLLVRRPVGISDDEVYTRLEKLDNKLNSALAMVCRYSEDSI